ncbi:MAG: dephospho-CoA kinase [Hungatella sp.]|nr:dephospho-CoA kinase [Hungatella sp.]MCI9503183.1 dephospho-CoA kinase [Hungatella sp.]MCI9638084.1 dephospho-CoA kinase [Hungatella sp.]
MEKKRVISLVGGVGSGKSRILELLKEEFGAEVIQADLVARQLEEPGRPGHKALLEAFGQKILGEDGYLRKDLLAALVFGDPEARERINGLIHPLVWDEVRLWALKSKASLVVVESAILSENRDDFFDEVWYVYTLKECRIRRLMDSRGYSREKCLKMMESQSSEEEFAKAADHMINNNGSMEDVRRQLRKVIKSKEESGT